MSTAKTSHPNMAHRFGRLILTTVRQGGGAPVIDGCSTATEDGRRGAGVAIKPSPTVGMALVIAWIGGQPVPRPATWRLVPKRLTRSRGPLA
jgi:hypothetical protein